MKQEKQTSKLSAGKYRGTKEYLLIYAELIQAAQCRGTVTYQLIAQIMGLPLKGNYMAGRVGRILAEISEEEATHDRPMLSSVAVGVNNRPGPGFFTLARKMGLLNEGTKESDLEFWAQQTLAVYKAWQTHFKA